MALRTRVWTLGRLVVIGGALVATFLLFAAVAVRVAVRARDVTVPDLTGASLADAAERLGHQQLSLRVDTAQRPSTEVPAGRVLGQDPRPDTSSRRQRSVRVWVSAGPRVSHMPGVVGETERVGPYPPLAGRPRRDQRGGDPLGGVRRRSGGGAGTAARPAGGGGAAAGQPRRRRGRLRDARSHRAGRGTGRGDPPPAGVSGQLRRPAGGQRAAVGPDRPRRRRPAATRSTLATPSRSRSRSDAAAGAVDPVGRLRPPRPRRRRGRSGRRRSHPRRRDGRPLRAQPHDRPRRRAGHPPGGQGAARRPPDDRQPRSLPREPTSRPARRCCRCTPKSCPTSTGRSPR